MALIPAGLERGSPLMRFAANDELHKSVELRKSGYGLLKELYAILRDERMKDEVAGVLLAFQTSARYCNLLVRAEVDLINEEFSAMMVQRLNGRRYQF
jgi:hypothetical protein